MKINFIALTKGIIKTIDIDKIEQNEIDNETIYITNRETYSVLKNDVRHKTMYPIEELIKIFGSKYKIDNFGKSNYYENFKSYKKILAREEKDNAEVLVELYKKIQKDKINQTEKIIEIEANFFKTIEEINKNKIKIDEKKILNIILQIGKERDEIYEKIKKLTKLKLLPKTTNRDSDKNTIYKKIKNIYIKPDRFYLLRPKEKLAINEKEKVIGKNIIIKKVKSTKQKRRWDAKLFRTITVIMSSNRSDLVLEEFDYTNDKHIEIWLLKDYGIELEVLTNTAGNYKKKDIKTLEELNIKHNNILLKLIIEIKKLDNKQNTLLNFIVKHIKNGYIKGNITQNGTRTGRCVYSNPNLSQIPSDKVFRELFTADKNKTFIGVDAEALELTIFADAVKDYDNGEMAKKIYYGLKENKTDIHSDNQKKLNLKTRGDAKKFIYSLFYGGSKLMIGKQFYQPIDVSECEFETAKSLLSKQCVIINNIKYIKIKKSNLIKMTDEVVLWYIYGEKLQETFLKKIKGYRELIEDLENQITENSYITHFFKKKTICKEKHKALSTHNQAKADVAMKLIQNNFIELLDIYGLKDSCTTMNFIHDEMIYQVEKKDVIKIKKLIKQSFEESSKELGLKFNIKPNITSGSNWYEIH